MSNRRPEFDAILAKLLGSENLYFQPPDNLERTYPCIQYEISTIKSLYANDRRYMHKVGYTVMLIGFDPDSKILEEILKLPLSDFVRHYVANGLNHDVYTIYY